VPVSPPTFGIRTNFPFGFFRYQFQRESHQRFVMTLEWESTCQVTLDADVVIPAMAKVNSWNSSASRDHAPNLPALRWDAGRHAMLWKETLAAGRHRLTREWIAEQA
jgi:hypothetical protein